MNKLEIILVGMSLSYIYLYSLANYLKIVKPCYCEYWGKQRILQKKTIYSSIMMKFLYCFVDVSHFQKLKEETSNDFDIHWNSEPFHIGK